MPYKLDRRPDHTLEVEAHLDSDVVDSERQKILKAYRGSARIPGFRPGKAPLSLVRTHFAAEVEGDLVEELARRAWAEVVEGEETLEPLTPLQVAETRIDEDGTFHLKGSLEVRPHFDLEVGAGLSLPEIPVEVGDEEVDEEIEKLLAEHAAWEPAGDAPAEDGMLVELDIRGEPEEGEPFTSEGVRFVLGDDEVFPEIQEALQGARAGEERSAERRFPDDHADQAMAGKKVRYTLKLGSIKRRVLPELDDEFAGGLGFDDVEALRTRVREVLERTKKRERRDRWRRALLDQLEEGLDLNELPSSLVQAGLKEELERYAYMMVMQGKNPTEEEIDWQEVSARMEPEVRKRVLDSLVLEQLAREWEIEVPEDEVEAFVEGDARQKGIPAAEHRANLEKEGRLDEIRHAARVAATVDELIRRAGGEVE